MLKPVEVNDDAAEEEELEDKDKFIDVLEEDDLEEDITVKVDDKFIGPAALAKAWRFVEDPRDGKKEERLSYILIIENLKII